MSSTALLDSRSPTPLELRKRGSMQIARWDIPAAFGTHRAVVSLAHGAARLVYVRVARIAYTDEEPSDNIRIYLGWYAGNPSAAAPITAPDAEALRMLLWNNGGTALLGGIIVPTQAILHAEDIGEVYGASQVAGARVLRNFYLVAEVTHVPVQTTFEVGFLPINRLDQIPVATVPAP